jgi:DsbC/DsbD-like thiol-disulfide interchange protein
MARKELHMVRRWLAWLEVRRTGLAAVLVAGLIALGARQIEPRPDADPQDPEAAAKRSDAVVQVQAVAEPVGADARQSVEVSLEVEEGWHIYANPAGLEGLVATTVTVAAGRELMVERLEYPPGKVSADGYKYYEGKVAVPVTVRRAAGDTSPLRVSVKFQACNDRLCLPPATVTLTVP